MLSKLQRKCYVIAIALTISCQFSFAQKIYKTPSGAKYHLGNCHMVKNISEEITFDDAKKIGLAPCLICKPTDVYSRLSLSSNTPQGEKKETSQCKGMTKNGTRCQHMTSLANGFCYQHNPGSQKVIIMK